MIAIATIPTPPTKTGPQIAESAPGGSMQTAANQNPFDLLLGMSVSLMSFEQSLAGGPAQQYGAMTVDGDQTSPWMLAARLQRMGLCIDNQAQATQKTAESTDPPVPSDEKVSIPSATSPSLLAQALAGQLGIQPQPPQPVQSVEAVGPNATYSKGSMPSEILQAAVPSATAESNGVQGVWNLSELSQPIGQALKARLALATSGNADETERTSGAAASKMAYDWSPSPVKDASGNTRMPQMIEQVQQISDFLAERTEGVIKVGKDGVEANMRLYPPDLGGVRVSLTIQNGTVQAAFVAERPETARLLQQQTPHFREMMSRHGLIVEQVQVTVAPSAASSGANAYHPGQPGAGQQDRQEALWSRQQQRDPDGQRPDQRQAWDETGD